MQLYRLFQLCRQLYFEGIKCFSFLLHYIDVNIQVLYVALTTQVIVMFLTNNQLIVFFIVFLEYTCPVMILAFRLIIGLNVQRSP